MKSLNKNSIMYLVLGVVLFLFYGNTLSNGFVHDSIPGIQNNPQFKESSIANVVAGCLLKDTTGTRCLDTTWRPIVYLDLFLTYKISPNPAVFHFSYIVFMFILSILVFHLIHFFIQDKRLALFGSLLFATHPVNSEVVNFATPEIILGIFFISSLLTYMYFEKKKKTYFLVISSVLFGFALFSKETAVFLLPLFALYTLLFTSFKRSNKSLKRYVLVVCFYIPWVVVYTLLRTRVLGSVIYTDPGYHELLGIIGVYNGLWMYPKYIFKLLYPIPLSFEHPFDKITVFDLRVLFSVLFVFLNGWVVYVLYTRKLKIILFGFLFFVLGLLPVLIFINKIGEFVFAERYLFMSTVGFVLIISEIVRSFLDRYKSKAVNSICIVLFLLYLGLIWHVVFTRNLDWKDPKAAFLSILRVDLKNVSAHLNLGNIYFQEGNIAISQAYYKKTLELDPTSKPASFMYKTLSNQFKAGGLEFYYPSGFTALDTNGKVFIEDLEKSVLITIEKKEKSKDESFQQYIAAQKVKGTILQEGLVKGSNFDFSYARRIQSKDNETLHFFFFRKNTIYEVEVLPITPQALSYFEIIVKTIPR